MNHPLPIQIEQQVFDFIRQQSPDPRRFLRAGLRKLALEEGDIQPLHGQFESYYRLRLGGFRVIFRYKNENYQRTIQCVLIERRAVVYQLFADIVMTLRETRDARISTTPRPVRYKSPARKRAPKKSPSKVIK